MRRLAVAAERAPDHALDGHPERPGRVEAAVCGIEDVAAERDVLWLGVREAAEEDLLRVHAPEYLRSLEAFCRRGGGQLDDDTYARRGSWTAAVRAAGAGIAAIDALENGLADVAFVAVRPPGHHALADQAMGFCLLNNVAIAAAKLASQGERVLIVDWDVHHGNGTQAAFWNDSRVLYASIHQASAYPGTGRAEERGGTEDRDGTINVALPAGATGDVVCRALGEIVGPAAARFDPTWVLVSAGYDAHRDDPLADLALSNGDYATMAATVAGFAPRDGRLALFFEGGYDLAAIRGCVRTTFGSLLGTEVPMERPTSGGPGMGEVDRVRRLLTEPSDGALW